MTANLFDLFAGRLPTDLSRSFIETADGRHYAYGDMLEISGRYARLLTKLGVQPGDRVAVQVEKSPEAVFLYLGVLRAGAVYLPLNTAYKKDEIAYFLGDAEPRLAVCRPSDAKIYADLYVELFGELADDGGAARVLTLGGGGDGTLADMSDALGGDFPTVARTGDDLAAILYTSGTTGRSKGAMMSHRNLAANALALHKAWGFGPGDVLLHALPIFHTHGLFVAINCVLLNATGMLFLERFDAGEVIRLLPRATVMMGVPTFYTRLLEREDFTEETCANMRLFISGSAPLLKATFDKFLERTGHTMLERYGMTETCMITSNPLSGQRLAGTVGTALAGVEVRVADKDGKILRPGEVGILEVRGANVFKGYWKMPDKTAAEFRADGFFITGDMARMNDDGVVSIVGRGKDLIISGGFNVYPKEVENALNALDGIGESAVIGLPHPDFGEAVAAVVTPGVNDGEIGEDAVIAALKQRMAAFKVPKKVMVVDQLPRNVMGKVRKNELRKRYKDLF
jgi:malonyl-CoA/methylmalonyl-CoA synthetase